MGCRAWLLLRPLLSIIFVCAAVAVPPARAADPADADPDRGKVTGRAYVNPYFGLRYPLPPGWTASPQPPPPSDDGYYVLSTPTPPPGAGATILIAAQDAFFAPPPLADAGDMARALRHSVSTHGDDDATSGTTTIAGQPFVRVELPGAPLSRIVFATNIRCHVVIFTFTGGDAQRLKQLAMSLEGLSFERNRPAPECVKGYATAQTIEHKTEPVPVGPQFARIPVRIVIGTDGGVEHIHVIRAVSSAQHESIEKALRRWRFAPYRASGRAAAVETGLGFEFKPSGRAR